MDNVTAIRMSSILILIVCVLLYFAPSVVGMKKQNRSAIFALNFFLGWTLVGWVVALVWALTTEAKPVQFVVQGSTVVQQPLLCAACGKYSAAGAAFCTYCGNALLPQSVASVISSTKLAPPSAMN
jgi:hypothetical protein